MWNKKYSKFFVVFLTILMLHSCKTKKVSCDAYTLKEIENEAIS